MNQRIEQNALRTQLAGFMERIEAEQSQATPYSPEQEKPPHY